MMKEDNTERVLTHLIFRLPFGSNPPLQPDCLVGWHEVRTMFQQEAFQGRDLEAVKGLRRNQLVANKLAKEGC